jgi:hypothetical protein
VRICGGRALFSLENTHEQNGEERRRGNTAWSFNQKVITKRQNLAGARCESSEQKSQARNLIWWHKNEDQWDLPVVGTELSWQATRSDRVCYASEQLILQRITENRRQKSKRKNKSFCSHGQGPGKRTEERKQGNGGLGSDDPKSTAHYKLQNKFFNEMKTRFTTIEVTAHPPSFDYWNEN